MKESHGPEPDTRPCRVSYASGGGSTITENVNAVTCYRAEQASQMVENFKYYQLWDDLTWEQQQRPNLTSVTQTILHRRAGWTQAAKAIMQYGLPKLEQPDQPKDATEHINALAQFAQDMTKWLQNFAATLHRYKQTDTYKKNYNTSINALHKRKRCIQESY